MESVVIMDQEILIFKDKDEANAYCRGHPEEKHKAWLEEETWRYCLNDPEELQAVIDAKRKRPGVK